MEVGSNGVWQQIDALTEENRRSRDPEVERQLVRLRYQAGVELCRQASGNPEDPTPDVEALEGSGPLPEITPEKLTPELVRAAILGHGALLIRGLVSAEDSAYLREEIDRAFEARERRAQGGPTEDDFYEEFDPGDGYKLPRGFVKNSGIWAPDSPRVMFDMLETFGEVGLRRTAREYLGEPPAVSMQKTTLRKAFPESSQHARWHQDGAFLGELGGVRALNVWLSLSHCGDDAPGLDLIPRRLDHIVPTGTEGAVFDWMVSPAMAEEAAGGLPVLRPIFEPGDVMLFDELYLHATATGPTMTKVRYAVECWYFGPSAFPGGVDGREYVPFAV